MKTRKLLLPLLTGLVSLAPLTMMSNINDITTVDDDNHGRNSLPTIERFEKLFTIENDENGSQGVKKLIELAYKETFNEVKTKIEEWKKKENGTYEFTSIEDRASEYVHLVSLDFQKALNRIFVSFKYGDKNENIKITSPDKRVERERKAFLFMNFNEQFNLRYKNASMNDDATLKQIYTEITGTSKETLEDNEKETVKFFFYALQNKELNFMESYYLPFYTDEPERSGGGLLPQ